MPTRAHGAIDRTHRESPRPPRPRPESSSSSSSSTPRMSSTLADLKFDAHHVTTRTSKVPLRFGQSSPNAVATTVARGPVHVDPEGRADAHPRMRKNERRGGHVCRRARPGASRVWHVGCVGVGVCLILYRYNPLYIPNTNAIPIPVRARAIACTHRSIDHTHRSIDHIASSRATCDGPPSTVDESLSTAGERGGARPPPVVDAAVGRVVVRTTRTRCQPAP
jgi:hypothetical protein